MGLLNMLSALSREGTLYLQALAAKTAKGITDELDVKADPNTDSGTTTVTPDMITQSSGR